MLHLTLRQRDLETAAALIRRGGVVVIPTDTAYGLAADPRSGRAIKRILKIKQRPPEKALPWVAGSVAQVTKYFLLTVAERQVAGALWPGPLSLVLPLRRKPQRVAVRVPAHPALRKLCLLVGHPLTATSANISGKPTAYSLAAVQRQFTDTATTPNALLDGGTLRRRAPSTIAEIIAGRVRIHRPGPVAQSVIERYV